MKPPSRIKVGPYDYILVADADLAQTADCVYGQTQTSRALILVNPKQAPSQLRDTVLHEVVHAVIDAASLTVGTAAPIRDHEDEERIVRPLTTGILAALRDNPRLVAFLTEK